MATTHTSSNKVRAHSVLVYDGDCGICTKCVLFVEKHLSRDIDIVAWQHADLPSLKLSQAECEESVQWVDPYGRVSSAQMAVGDLLKDSGRHWRPLGVLIQTLQFTWVAWVLYKWIAKNRDRFPGGTPACAMAAHLRPGADRSAAPQTPQNPADVAKNVGN